MAHPVLGLAVLDVVLDGLCHGRAHRPLEVAVAPERVTPKLAFHSLPQLVPYPVRGHTFEPLDHVGDGVVLAPAHEEVDVIRSEHGELVACTSEALPAHPPHLAIREHVPPILGREDQMEVLTPPLSRR